MRRCKSVVGITLSYGRSRSHANCAKCKLRDIARTCSLRALLVGADGVLAALPAGPQHVAELTLYQ
jgi:hypothetical protein